MDTNRLCIEFQILNASRPGEARGATWAEIDLDKAIWTIPAEKMKAGKEHRVPLSDRSIEILHDPPVNTSTRKPDGPVFRNLKTNRELTYNATADVLKRRGLPYVPHGFRASFRSWAMEQPGFAWAACERSPGPRHRRRGGRSVRTGRPTGATAGIDASVGRLLCTQVLTTKPRARRADHSPARRASQGHVNLARRVLP